MPPPYHPSLLGLPGRRREDSDAVGYSNKRVASFGPPPVKAYASTPEGRQEAREEREKKFKEMAEQRKVDEEARRERQAASSVHRGNDGPRGFKPRRGNGGNRGGGSSGNGIGGFEMGQNQGERSSFDNTRGRGMGGRGRGQERGGYWGGRGGRGGSRDNNRYPDHDRRDGEGMAIDSDFPNHGNGRQANWGEGSGGQGGAGLGPRTNYPSDSASRTASYDSHPRQQIPREPRRTTDGDFAIQPSERFPRSPEKDRPEGSRDYTASSTQNRSLPNIDSRVSSYVPSSFSSQLPAQPNVQAGPSNWVTTEKAPILPIRPSQSDNTSQGPTAKASLPPRRASRPVSPPPRLPPPPPIFEDAKEDIKPTVEELTAPTIDPATQTSGTLVFSKSECPPECYLGPGPQRNTARQKFRILHDAKIKASGRTPCAPPKWRDDGVGFDWEKIVIPPAPIPIAASNMPHLPAMPIPPPILATPIAPQVVVPTSSQKINRDRERLIATQATGPGADLDYIPPGRSGPSTPSDLPGNPPALRSDTKRKRVAEDRLIREEEESQNSESPKKAKKGRKAKKKEIRREEEREKEKDKERRFNSSITPLASGSHVPSSSRQMPPEIPPSQQPLPSTAKATIRIPPPPSAQDIPHLVDPNMTTEELEDRMMKNLDQIGKYTNTRDHAGRAALADKMQQRIDDLDKEVFRDSSEISRRKNAGM